MLFFIVNRGSFVLCNSRHKAFGSLFGLVLTRGVFPFEWGTSRSKYSTRHWNPHNFRLASVTCNSSPWCTRSWRNSPSGDRQLTNRQLPYRRRSWLGESQYSTFSLSTTPLRRPYTLRTCVHVRDVRTWHPEECLDPLLKTTHFGHSLFLTLFTTSYDIILFTLVTKVLVPPRFPRVLVLKTPINKFLFFIVKEFL